MSIYAMRTKFGHILKWVLFLIIGIFVAGAFVSFGPGMFNKNQQQQKGSDAAVATVNGLPITRQEFENSWQQISQSARDNGYASTTLQMADVRGYVFNQMVQSRLLLSAAKREGVGVDESQLDAKIDEAVVEQLKMQRRTVLGELSKEKESLDPRQDSEFKSELRANKLSLSDIENNIRSNISRSAVESALAQEALVKKISGPVKPNDVTDSYNVYNIRQIFIPTGSGPEEQAAAQAKKIADKAKSGDFSAVAKQYSKDPYAKTGGQAQYSFETSYMYPQEVGSAITKMQSGDVSRAIKSQMGFFIIKMEKMTQKLPAKFDKKTRDERKKQIEQMRQYMTQQKISQMINEKSDVKVIDPELRGYWEYGQLRQAKSPQDYQKILKSATKSLETAVKHEPSNTMAAMKLASLYKDSGKNAEAIKTLSGMLAKGSSVQAQGFDAPLMLGDLLVARNQKDDKNIALDMYQRASDRAIADVNTHKQLATKFKQLGRADLADKESKLAAALEQRIKENQAAEQKARDAAGKGAKKPASK